jgi:zinc-finger-containing domain
MEPNTITIYPCIECGETPSRVTGRDIYPHLPDLHSLTFWLCVCGAYVGSHKRDGSPLGSPAGRRTKDARIRAHKWFDPIWQSGRMTAN